MSAMSTESEELTGVQHFLRTLGLEEYFPNKLTLRSLFEINENSIDEKAVLSLEEIPWCFLRKLFKINAECRSCTQLSIRHEENNDLFDLDLYTAEDSADSKVNPLDVIVALFLCADSLLQQEMALKMSLCQFSLPLLLPHGNKSQCALMHWALRDIVKEWCPHDLSESKGFVEENIIQANIPFYSFVRLKNCSLSKSQFLNHLLSSGQQSCSIFTHRDVEGGAVKRQIANGLVEVCWYLPSGGKTLDIFPEPIGFANLRGDIRESLTQFNFLFQVSTATFVFLDRVDEEEHRILTSLQDVKSKLFLVVNRNGENARQDMMLVKTLVGELNLSNNRVKIKDSRQNVTEFSNRLCEAMKTSLLDVKSTISIENMFDKAIELGLSVDESKTDKQREAAEEIMDDIGVRSIPHYKKQQLPLQGENWKRLSQLEKEECRLKKPGDSNLEEYKLQLHAEKEQIRKDQRKCKVSEGMKRFIQYLSSSDKEERDVFLKWMKLKFNTHSRTELSKLRNKFKEQCKNKDVKLIAELDQALVDSSLGIEHYMREMGLIYEFSTDSISSPIAADKIAHLPALAAEMLLDGYPLELLDGDASNIPERWVTDVLMELHKKVGQKSRLLVLTVLGVQSSGKSTLLNTMFGVQFPVSSGRCTRGAFMLFLKVGEDLKSELNCDFIVVIDTEGLKAPDLAQLEDSYEHDNQLATFVIGLSDVTIINIAMENANEMKDVLQIAVHAFLRMKEIGKKPVCYFVHQNVSSVSAHTKTMTERKHLLDQLNEMTQIAAEMERKPAIKEFTDVLDYDMEKNNWNIPGLWHGTPPMAPVNTGYSEAVAHFKKHLLQTVMSERSNEPSQILEFLVWMTSLWKAVKYENFIFSFRNTLVAHAYDSLWKECNQWEWEFRKEILTWQTAAELEILNADNESALETWNRLVGKKKLEATQKIVDQETIMKEKLCDYYKRRGKRVNLIEKYKAEFSTSIRSLANEIKHSVYAKLDCALELKITSKQTQDIQRQYRNVIEKRVMKLLGDCNESTLTDEELTQEFEKMWAEATVNVGGVKERDIAACVLKQLRKSFSNRNVNEELQNIRDLNEFGRCAFKTTSYHVDSFLGKVQHLWSEDLQIFANSVIKSCTQFVLDKVMTNGDYQESFTKELLETIDKALEKDDDNKTNTQFEIDLKIHMCGIASREFLKMHRKFLTENNPHSQLEKYKSQYRSDFLDLYRKKDHCQRKANYFVQLCIKPAVKEYICRSLGIDIVDEILTSSHSAKFSSRSFFQYNIQKELLQKDDFNSFLKYIDQYEMYVKDWIFQHIQEKMAEDKTLCKLKNNILHIILNKITRSIEWASKDQGDVMLPDDKENITKLIRNMRTFLIKDISISEESVKTTLFQIQSKCHQFINCLKTSINELKDELEEEFSNSDNITETLNQLPIKPQEELFKRVFGCGKQCPFCSAPCEAGGTEHKEHHTAIHRPQGLGRFHRHKSRKLVTALCTTDVHSEKNFRNRETGNKWHPYKDYIKYYPDWIIPPDPTIEASDYWKYVLVQNNMRFAQEYEAEPADVPEAWRTITKQQALKGLQDAFNMK
ncbi:up-regulator of cell proliferation-like [Solea solea]|uniref:up-regulator of cell proliferation-like n=1 Tax=Solea solea TaxID=90069 RepID=UPI0027297281|nr:up-regulator of cell proliferation-like [Solea solea]